MLSGTIRPWALFTAAWLTVLALGSAANAAAQIATASVFGTIRDETGASLPGVTLTARNVATGATRATTSDAEGRYRLSTSRLSRHELQMLTIRTKGRAVDAPSASFPCARRG